MDRIGFKQQTQLDTNNTRCSISDDGNVSRTWASKSDNNSKSDRGNKRHRHNKYLLAIGSSLAITGFLPVNVYAQTDVGGVSATANPVANSSGSVTNQAIQVLQGPYITNTYGGGIQCQGPTLNITPYVTRTMSWQDPFEEYYNDPVYNNVDANDDGVPDNPGEVLYYVPTRTGQKDTHNWSVGVSATISHPLDKKLQNQCKEAVAVQIDLQRQLTANKRLDFEIARLKNCGELKKAGIIFHPKSPYAGVCADVMLVNPPGVVAQHTHTIDKGSLTPKANGTAENLGTFSIGNPISSSSESTSKEEDLSSNDTGLPTLQIGTVSEESSQESSEP